MAFKTRNYSGGDEFVPSGKFGDSKEWGQGPKSPGVPLDLGPTADVVNRGPAFGGVRMQDGARIMDDPKPTFPNKLKPAANHLPENA